MKHVLICSVYTPFIVGGAEILATDLRRHLQRRGFGVEAIHIPFRWYPVKDLVRQALVWRLFDLVESNGTPIDLVIATKHPSYIVPHPHKVTWLFHQHRQAYDLHGTEYGAFENTPEHDQIRSAIHTMDTQALAECRALFAISQNVANRLQRYNGLSAQALYPPPQYVGRYRNDAYGDYIFFVGRLDRLKRLDLALNALAHARSGARLKIAGVGPVERELRDQITRLGIEDRVELLGSVSETELLQLYAGCRAAYYAPHDEDYGYVTVEAFLSQKPVLTTTDSGGPLEFVADGETGLISAPEAAAIADTLDRLWALPEARLREMGEAGRRRVEGITWDHVIDRLTETLR